MYASRSTIMRRSLGLRNGGREIVFCDPNRELQITVHDVHTNFVCPTEQIVRITKWVRVNGVDYILLFVYFSKQYLCCWDNCLLLRLAVQARILKCPCPLPDFNIKGNNICSTESTRDSSWWYSRRQSGTISETFESNRVLYMYWTETTPEFE